MLPHASLSCAGGLPSRHTPGRHDDAGGALHPLRPASAPPLLEAGVPPRLRQRSRGHPPRETPLVSCPLTQKGHEEASERRKALRHGLLPCSPCASSSRPLPQSTGSARPPSPPRTVRASAPSHRAQAVRTAPAALRAQPVADTLASILPGALAPAPRVRRRQRASGASPTATHSSRARTSSAPAPSLRPCGPASARRNAPRPRPGCRPLPWPVNRSPQLSAASAPLSWGVPGVCTPGGGTSSPLPTSMPWCPGGALPGPPGLAPRPPQLLGASASALAPLPCALPRREAPRRSARAERSPGRAPPLERAQSGQAPRRLRLHLPGSVWLHGRSLPPPSRAPPGPHRHVHLPDRGPCTPPHRPPRRHGVSPPVPPAGLAAGLHESAPLRRSPCARCRPARNAPPAAGAAPPQRGPAATASPPARSPLSDLGRIEARRHAPVDLSQGLCRDQLSGRTVPGRACCATVWPTHGPRALAGQHLAPHDGGCRERHRLPASRIPLSGLC
jgi:hypothetical protein